MKNFRDSLLKGDLEASCHWATEMDLSDWQEEMWNSCFDFAVRHTIQGSPKIAIYLEEKFRNFLKVFEDASLGGYKIHQLPEWRNTWIEIVGVLSLTKKNAEISTLPRIEVGQLDAFVDTVKTIETHTLLLNFPEFLSREPVHHILLKFISQILKDIEINRVSHAFTTLAFLLEYDNHLKRNKVKMQCVFRSKVPAFSDIFLKTLITKKPELDSRNRDWIWVLWDALEVLALNYQNTYYLFGAPTDLLCRSLKAMRFQFSLGFDNPGQKKVRIAFLVQAMITIATFPQSSKEEWSKAIVDVEGAKLVFLAKKNIQIMYDDIIQQSPQKQPVKAMPLPLAQVATPVQRVATLDVSAAGATAKSVILTDSMEKMKLMEMLDPFMR